MLSLASFRLDNFCSKTNLFYLEIISLMFLIWFLMTMFNIGAERILKKFDKIFQKGLFFSLLCWVFDHALSQRQDVLKNYPNVLKKDPDAPSCFYYVLNLTVWFWQVWMDYALICHNYAILFELKALLYVLIALSWCLNALICP